MIITEKQIAELRPYMPDIDDYIQKDNLGDFEAALEQVMLKIGFENDEPTQLGLKLERLYDKIYYQND